MKQLKLLMMGGAIKPYLEKCTDICKESYADLSTADQKYIDELLVRAPEAFEFAKKYAPFILSHVKDIKGDQVLGLLQLATKYLKRKSTKAMVHKLIAQYGDIVKDKRRMKAIGAYIKCVVSNIDDEYKVILIASFDMLMALVSVVTDKEIADFAKELGDLVHKSIVKPTVRQVKAVKSKK